MLFMQERGFIKSSLLISLIFFSSTTFAVVTPEASFGKANVVRVGTVGNVNIVEA